MAGAYSPFTVLLIGRTGMGKSCTGNKLLNAVTKDNPKGNVGIKRVWPQEEVGSLSFATNQDVHSVTQHCELLVKSAGEADEVRVLDSEGFAGSNVTDDVHLGNLKVAREIVGVSSELDLAFDSVLYFLPMRGRPERADGTLQEEIGVMWHFFGENMFKNMVLITTLAEEIPPEYAPNEAAVQKVFGEAMKLALEKRGIRNPPPCPPVLFIPLGIDNSALLKGLKGDNIRGDKAYKPEFSKEVCGKCASSLYCQEDGTLMVVRTGDDFLDTSHNMCHPAFIPKHSKLVRFLGGIVFIILVSVPGYVQLLKKKGDKPTWAGFYNSKEVCANCKEAPGSKGCMKVGDSSKKYEKEVIQHSNNVQSVVLDNGQ